MSLLFSAVKPWIFIWALVILMPVGAQAETATSVEDELLLKNGSRLFGTVVTVRDRLVTLNTSFAGTLSISMDDIVSVNNKNPVVMLLADQRVIASTSLIIDQENLVLPDSAQTYPVEDLAVINPQPWELGKGYRWTGSVSFALALQRGNTDSDELNYRLDPVWRSKQDRYTVKASGELDETNGKQSANNWQIIGKYDYFLAGPRYTGFFVSVENDKFQDLDIRYVVGPYYGSQFYDKPIFSLQGELGVSYVKATYDIAETQRYGAATWNVHMTSNYLGGKSALYFDQLGIWNLKDTSDIILNTTFGLSFPLMWDLEAAAEMLFEYDSGAVMGVDDLDQTYKIRLGYTW